MIVNKVMYAIASSPAASLPEFVPKKPSTCTNFTYRLTWYTRDHIPVPNASLLAVRTPRGVLVYRPCLCSPLILNRPLSCTKRHIRSCPYSKRPSAVPIVVHRTSGVRLPFVRQDPLVLYQSVCTPDPLVLYQDSFVVPFVPHSPFSCTECVSESCSYVKGLSSVPNRIEEIFTSYRSYASR